MSEQLSCHVGPVDDENWIFVVGKPRSETTWLLSLQGEHPQCLRVTMEILGLKTDRPTLETGLFARSLTPYYIRRRIAELPSDEILIEKTPSHLLEIENIKTLLPEARFVLIRRQPLDVIFSMLQENVFWIEGRPKTIDEALIMFARFHEAEIKYREHYANVIEYESLWADPALELRRLLRILCLDDTNAEALVAANRGGRQLPEPLKRVFRKGLPGQGQAGFRCSQRAHIKRKLAKCCAAKFF